MTKKRRMAVVAVLLGNTEPDDKVSEVRTEEAVKRILIDGEEVSLKATITYLYGVG